jgi:hypothetical protein
MDVCAAFIANLQASVAVQPRVSALHHPAVATEPLLRLKTFPSDTRLDATPAQSGPVFLRRVSFVRVQLVRTFARPPAWPLDRFDRIHGGFEHRRLVDVGCGQEDRERDALSIDHKMPLRALFAAIRWIFPSFFAPPGEATEEASIETRLQSMRSACPRRSSRAWWRRSQTPAFCQSRRRRQHVIPLPQPISLGNISQGMPLRRTKRMPVKAARSGTRGRPPLGFGFSGGNKEATNSQRVSSTSGRISCPTITRTLFC